MSSYATQLDSVPLLNTLINKTQAGKLKWDETADEDIFLVSVGGNTTLKVQRKLDRSVAPAGGFGFTRPGQSGAVHRYILSLLDENGKLIWEIEEPWALTKELFVLARRVARKVDERVDALMGTLQRL